MHGLHVVTVEVAQEDAVVARVVLGPLTRGVQHLRTRRHSSFVDRVDCVAVDSAEGQVQLPGLGAGGWSEPEIGEAVGPDKPTTKVPPCGKRITSRMPIGAKVRR